jgi:hypothetical protein
MPKHSAPQPSTRQLRQNLTRRIIRKMTVSRRNSLSNRPWSLHIIQQQPLIVVRLNHERIHITSPLPNQTRRVSQIRQKTHR